MTDSYVLIMQKTPFPGFWQPMPMYQLEEAEYLLKLNRQHYHECGRVVGDYRNRLVLYPEDIARRIVAYWQAQFDYGEFTLLMDI